MYVFRDTGFFLKHPTNDNPHFTGGVMGTASTMACLLVALGLMPLKGATAPAVSSTRLRVAEETGKIAVDITKTQLKPQQLLTRESFLNAITVLQAIGGSTNAIVHLLAIINRHPSLAASITLDTIDEIGRKTPLLVDLKPSGENYMTDFHNSGGMLALLHQLKPLLHLNAMTITGRTLGEEIASAPYIRVPRTSSTHCIRPLADPLYPASSLVLLRGNLAPNGAVMKASASKYKRLLKHTGRAVVFNSPSDLSARIDSPDLDVDANSVLILQNIGPIGNPGMPEAGLVPIPRKLAEQGVEDMLRISDGRMSGTAGGTVVLHVSPEAADLHSVFGVVRDGDMVVVDVEERVLTVDLSDEEIKKRVGERVEREGKRTEERRSQRGYRGLYVRSVNQAHEGADFGFLNARGPDI